VTSNVFAVLDLIAIIVSLLAMVLVIAPRRVPRQIRYLLALLVMWQWKKLSRLSAIIHNHLWQKGNGH
jgi:flagellar biosynthesis protein FliR